MELQNPEEAEPEVKSCYGGAGLLIPVLVHLARDNHHPYEEYRSNDPESEDRLPTLTCTLVSTCFLILQSRAMLTDVLLLQPGQCLLRRPIGPVIKHKSITLVVDIVPSK